MIEAIVNRIMRWDSLRNAVFDEVNMYNSLTRIINDPESMKTAAAYWEEKAGWKGWNTNNNKYYFNDIEENTKIIFFSTSTLEESLGDDIREDHDKWNIWNEDYR